MSAVLQQLPALQVVIPLFGALLVAFLRNGRAAFALTLIVTWSLPVISALLLRETIRGGAISYHLGGWEPPWGIEYRIDILSAFVLLLVSTVSAVIMPFAWRSVPFEVGERRAAWFYCMFLLCVTGLLGITATGDAFNAFVFLEISSLSTYVLLALGPDRRALLSAYQYLVVGTIGATFYVIGIGLIYLVTGTLNMADMADRIGEAWPEQSRAIIAALAFISVGISLKLALFPLHGWLPNAYAHAPSWSTVFLAASATKVAIYLLIRYYWSVFGAGVDFESLPIAGIVLTLSVLAMIVASLVAVFETNLKRMLAYSSVAQIGYITLGIGLGNPTGLTGALVHLVNHAFMKAALFMAAGAMLFRACQMDLKDITGIGKTMPLTALAFSVAGLGLVGTPGTSGFISKWYLISGALERGSWPLVVAIVASSVIALVYVGRVLEIMWLREPSPAAAAARDPDASMLAPMLLLAGATIYFGLDTRWTVGVASQAAASLFGAIP